MADLAVFNFIDLKHCVEANNTYIFVCTDVSECMCAKPVHNE